MRIDNKEEIEIEREEKWTEERNRGEGEYEKGS